MPAKPDLSLHTLIHFLDRFVYRNAKSMSTPRGISIMQPLAGEDKRGMLLSSRGSSKARGPVNMESFWAKKAENVDVNEVFFHKYFNQIGKGGAATAANKKKKDKQLGNSDENEDEDDEIWTALVKSRPEVEGSDEGDSDLDMDMDMEDIGSDDEIIGLDVNEPLTNAAEPTNEVNGPSDDDQGIDLASEEEALFDSEEDVPSDLDPAFDKEIEGAEPESKSQRKKRRKLKNLPTFASVEDYAEMLAGDDDE